MLAMMVDLEDDHEWARADELEDDDYDRYGLESWEAHLAY